MNTNFWSRALLSFIALGGLFFISFSFTNCGEYQASQFASDNLMPLPLPEPEFPSPPPTALGIDEELQAIVKANKLTKLSDPTEETLHMVLLGKVLFSDTGMSGLNDVSCATCHQVEVGSGDGMPFPIGSGGEGEFPLRKQINGRSKPMRRHSPAIFNKGRTDMKHALWDGRLQFMLGQPSTPVKEISGPRPERPDITGVFENALDIQPLFPLITPEEFFGFNNDLSKLPNDPARWDEILETRVLAHDHYRMLFTKAYPEIEPENINPGHIARAVRAFVKTQFKANDTPFDQYLDGDLTALTEKQKRGMKVFYGKGRCNVCHSGPRLSNDGFYSVAVPQLGFHPFQDDLGREEFSKHPQDRYKFKTPGLRNVKLSGPYMHNGAFKTLQQVIDHKNNVKESLYNYTIPENYQFHYDEILMVDKDKARNFQRIEQVDIPALKNGLSLTQEEKDDLLEFLNEGLLDTNFKER